MWEKEKHRGRVDLRASFFNLVCVHIVCMGLACVCVCVCVFPGSREAKQRLTSSRRPWVCMCLPLCKASLLLTNPMRLESAAARVRGRATHHPGKACRAGGLAGHYGTQLDDDGNRNTSSSLGHFCTLSWWSSNVLFLHYRWSHFDSVDAVVDQSCCVVVAARLLQVTSLQRLQNVLPVKLHKVTALCLVALQGLRKLTKRNPAQHNIPAATSEPSSWENLRYECDCHLWGCVLERIHLWLLFLPV